MEEDAAELLKGKDSHRVWGRDCTEPTMLLSFLFFFCFIPVQSFKPQNIFLVHPIGRSCSGVCHD
jgi:hypothetical protein